MAFNADAPLLTVTTDTTVQSNGLGAISALGQVEAFRIDQSSDTPENVFLIINPAAGITLSLPVGTPSSPVFQQPNGSIVLMNPARDADGFYRIPEMILDQLQGHDLQRRARRRRPDRGFPDNQHGRAARV